MSGSHQPISPTLRFFLATFTPTQQDDAGSGSRKAPAGRLPELPGCKVGGAEPHTQESPRCNDAHPRELPQPRLLGAPANP
jgi:hypothetical protein